MVYNTRYYGVEGEKPASPMHLPRRTVGPTCAGNPPTLHVVVALHGEGACEGDLAILRERAAALEDLPCTLEDGHVLIQDLQVVAGHAVRELPDPVEDLGQVDERQSMAREPEVQVALLRARETLVESADLSQVRSPVQG